jgi:thymidylate synthase
MSKADKLFVSMCRNVLDNGTNTQDQAVRPHWPDGTSAYTIKQFGVVNRYNLQEEFPAITLRKTGVKSAIDEILWIYQKKSNNIKDLRTHIWDEWADEEGSIKKAYGYQAGLKHKFKEGEFDQVDYALWQLKNTPFSRRIIITLWNPHDLDEMGLQPCALMSIFNVTKAPGDDKLTLNLHLVQRSQDILAANNWNVVQYAALLMMFAQVNDMRPGELLHTITDAHIYDRHVPIIERMLDREQFPAPKVTLDPTIKNFYDFTPESFTIENYKAGPQEKFEVAI